MPVGARQGGLERPAVRTSTNASNRPLSATKDNIARTPSAAICVNAILDMEEKTVQHGWVAARNLARMEASASKIGRPSDAIAPMPSVVFFAKNHGIITITIITRIP